MPRIHVPLYPGLTVTIGGAAYPLRRETGAWLLTNAKGVEYTIRRGACNCPAALYNGVSHNPKPGGCKHAIALREFGILLLEEPPDPPPAKPETPNEEPDMETKTPEQIQTELAEPFDASEVKWKPGAVAGNRALALAYVDARCIMDRLDEVVGAAGWADEYTLLPGGEVKCTLRVRLGEEWVAKEDVGGKSEQPDEGDQMKAAFSDGLKRCAVKFGIGRHLYRLPQQWCDWDAQKRKFVTQPQLPGMVAAQPAKPAPAPKPVHQPPANGAELQKRLKDYDAKLAAAGVCRPGELVGLVTSSGVKAGYDPDLAKWDGPAILFAAEQTKQFEAAARAKPVTPAEPPRMTNAGARLNTPLEYLDYFCSACDGESDPRAAERLHDDFPGHVYKQLDAGQRAKWLERWTACKRRLGIADRPAPAAAGKAG